MLVCVCMLCTQSRGPSVAGGLGSPHVRQRVGLLLLRPQGDRVEGGERLLGQDVRVHGTRVVRSGHLLHVPVKPVEN